MCSSDTQKIRQAWNMARSFRGQVVPLHVTKSPSNACMPHQNHKKRTAHRHSRLSTQTNYQSNHTHADKVMHAIQQVIREIRKLGSIENLQEAQDLQQLVNGANDYLQRTNLLNTQPSPRVNHNQHLIGSKRRSDNCKINQSLPRLNNNQHSIGSKK